ncbi:MAG: DNA methyltransferase [Nanoarchaeota archaeon]|mgnify:CR=1 FL=1
MELLYEDLAKENGSQLFHIKKRIIIESIPNIQMELKEIFQQLAEDSSWVFEDLTQKDTSYATHGFHKYPAKFIPQLAKRCIEENTNSNGVVCDPFMGCGTTLIESLVSGRKVVGVDINPVAYLISKVKTTPINPEKLKTEIDKVLLDLDIYFKSNNKQKTLSKVEILPKLPINDRIEYWFPDKKIREDLSIILGRIDTIKDKDIRDFCLCAFSNILKNASIWLMKSIKPTRDLNKKIDSPTNLFSRQIKKMSRGNETYWNILPAPIKNNLKDYLNLKKADARNLPAENNSVDLIVTSPPYVTSYEYADLHQLTALWFEYTQSVNEFREGFIGSVHKKEFDHNGIKSKLAKQEIEELGKKSKKEAEAVKNYFFEMQQCFEEMHRVLKPEGRAGIVIGNTELRKVPILNAEVFVEILLNLGFKMHKIIKRRIPSKVLPQTRDSKTGRFTSTGEADRLAYAYEYILIMEKL